MNSPANASSTNPVISWLAVHIVLFAIFIGLALWLLFPRWLERDYHPIERVSASDHVAPARYRLSDYGSEPDIEVTVAWKYGEQDVGEEAFLLERVPAHLSNKPWRGMGRSVPAERSVNWDNEIGGGGYSVDLDPTSAVWTCKIYSYWIQNKKYGKFSRQFPVIPFKTKALDDGDLHVTIEYKQVMGQAPTASTSPSSRGK